MLEMATTKVILHWFRRDLRFSDNRGWASALRRAVELDAKVLPIFIFDRQILGRLEDRDDARVSFLHQRLGEMKTELRALGSDVLCLHGDPVSIWKKILNSDLRSAAPPSRERGLGLEALGVDLEIVGVTLNSDYEPYARERDRAVEGLVRKKEIRTKRPIFFLSEKDHVIFEKNEVSKEDLSAYTVFTPYAKKWRKVLESRMSGGESPLRESRAPKREGLLLSFQMKIPSLKKLGFQKNSRIEFPASRIGKNILRDYAKHRDLPAVAGTSRLGLHLRFGTGSVRKLVASALEMRSDVWLKELIWREFFLQILWNFPQVQEFAFRPEYERILWRNDEEEFAAWCEGRTGFPLVDAGMRELNATGFMHNRVRMVAASFLVKHLLVDWRWGEAYFARRLLDFDLAANNGNWQWVAGTGCDAAPYFRIFNPTLQAKRFDPDSEYIRKWVPEFGTSNQIAPIVDHEAARARALRAYAVIKSKPE